MTSKQNVFVESQDSDDHDVNCGGATLTNPACKTVARTEAQIGIMYLKAAFVRFAVRMGIGEKV